MTRRCFREPTRPPPSPAGSKVGRSAPSRAGAGERSAGERSASERSASERRAGTRGQPGSWKLLFAPALALALLLVAVTGCEGGGSPSVGSESHFLRSCDASCAGGFSCECGVCTRSCDPRATDACGGLPGSASCVAAADREEGMMCPDTSGPICDVTCTGDAQCEPLGSGYGCVGGFCRAEPLTTPGPSTGLSVNRIDTTPPAVSGLEDGQVAVEELCATHVSALCRRTMRCAWEANDTLQYASAQHCLDTTPCAGADHLAAQLRAGRLDYDPARAAECYAAFDCRPGFLDEPTLAAALRSCGALVGQQPAGAPCAHAAECAPGTTCELDACPGTCVSDGSNLPEGSPCDVPVTCFLEDSSLAQKYGDCAPCAPGLLCRSGSCQQDWQLGDSCGQVSDCAPSLWCDRSSGRCAEPAAEGAACAAQGPRCQAGLWCDGDPGVCRGVGGAGDPCEQQLQCEAPLACLPEGVCGEALALGAACTDRRQCASHLCLDGSCVAGGELGEFCREGVCGAELVCGEGTCLKPAFPGEACDDDDWCVHGRCVDGTCHTETATGQPCGAPRECASRACEGGVCVDPTVPCFR